MGSVLFCNDGEEGAERGEKYSLFPKCPKTRQGYFKKIDQFCKSMQKFFKIGTHFSAHITHC
ncbi:MAG: hypothetical protein D6805_02810 [Planctomycetota bacterium]|nr:MAG: hypothetical protein D6805_02810 [Planctomycetota bacterium]